jgi:hypothetical protein
MRKPHKTTNIALIFIVIASAVFLQLAYASEAVFLRVPMGGVSEKRINDAEDFFVPDSAKGLELRKTMRHDMGNISSVVGILLYDKKAHSEDFNKAKKSLFLYIEKLYEILENYNNVNWESDFKNTFNEFMNNFNDDVVNILRKEMDERRTADLKDFIHGIKLFYKSF